MLEDDEWTFLFELQWWHGKQFVQRFHVYSVPNSIRDGRILVWDRAEPLYQIQIAYKRLRKVKADLGIVTHVATKRPPRTTEAASMLTDAEYDRIDGHA